MTTQTPTVGRIVHYTLREGANAGQVRPAIITRTWGDTPESCVQLKVFLDEFNDAGAEQAASSAVQGTEPGQWFWPPRA